MKKEVLNNSILCYLSGVREIIFVLKQVVEKIKGWGAGQYWHVNININTYCTKSLIKSMLRKKILLRMMRFLYVSSYSCFVPILILMQNC